MPGLIDSHSHIGSAEGADSTAPIQPDVRILDSLDARHSSIQKAQAGGITTVNVMPGSGHLLSGQTLYLKLRDGRVVDDLLIRLPDGRIAGGIKMANGTNPRRAGPFPGSRAKSVALVREQFVKAIEYRDKIQKANGDASRCRLAICEWNRSSMSSMESGPCSITHMRTTTSSVFFASRMNSNSESSSTM